MMDQGAKMEKLAQSVDLVKMETRVNLDVLENLEEMGNKANEANKVLLDLLEERVIQV